MEVRSILKSGSHVVLVEASSAERVRVQKPKLVLNLKIRDGNQLIVDSDGVIRRAWTQYKGRPSLSNRVYNQLYPDAPVLNRLKDPHFINFLGPAGTIPQCTARAYEQKLCPSLTGKILLLTDNLEDYPSFQTPFGEMSSPEILANDIETWVGKNPISIAPLWARLAITLLMVTIGAFYILYYPVLLSAVAITGTGTAVILILFQLIFQTAHYYIPSANIIFSLFSTYLVFTGYRLAHQENLQWRSLKEAQYLKELDQMKTNFLSLVSHDLKTPLAKIQALVERMRRELNLPNDERSDWREFLDSIENSNHEMRRFITSILNLSKLESQEVILNKKSNDINRLIVQAINRLNHLAQQKNIEFVQSLDPLFSIECDEDLMRQVLTNLIDNAIKFSHPSSQIIVRSREEEGFVRVEVEDFGLGIPKDQLPFMFRKFSRFLRPVHEQIKGTGLGLYLSKYFIELHGGSILVKSIEGQGTTFSFTLPLQGEVETILG
jgi:signal transduction histidine kinase